MVAKEEHPQATPQTQIGAIDARDSQGAVFMPQGPVTQIHGTQQNVHTGGGDYIVDKLQVAHLNLTMTAAGGLVNQVAAALPTLTTKPRPVLRLPDYVPSLVGRADELSTLAALLDRHRFVELYGPADIGKSALLEVSATQPSAETLPNGVLFLRSRQTVAADLLQEIHDEFFACSIPNLKFTDTQVAHDLATIRALIVLDNDRLPKEELELLLAGLKSSHVLFSTRQRGGRHPGRIRTMALQGLSLPAARELYRVTLERPLTEKESATVDALLTALDGAPGAVIREAVIARDEEQAQAMRSRRQQPSTAPIPTPTIDRQAQQLISQLTQDERNLVAVLAAVYNARLGEEPLLRMAAVATTSPALAALVHKQVVRTSSPRYSLVEPFVPLLLTASDAPQWRERVVADLLNWMRAPTTSPEQILEEQEAILQLLRQAVTAARWREVLLLARAVEAALIVGRQWGAWQQVLEWQVQAARSLRDLAAEGWALHQQGTRALCLGDAAAAQTLLSQALTIRVQLRDRAGADVTRHNLNLVQPPPPPPSSTPPRAPSRPPSQGHIPAHYRVTPDNWERNRRGTRWPWLLGGAIIIVLFWATLWRETPVVLPTVVSPTIAAPRVNQPEFVPTSTDLPTAEAIILTPIKPSALPEATWTSAPPSVIEEEEVPVPLITFFDADAQKLTPGEITYLRWEVLDATSLVLEPYQIELSGYNEYPVELIETTTFVLRASNASGVTLSPEVTIEVVQPSILDFYPKSATVQAGEPVELCYVTENAAEVEIQPEIGFLSNLGKDPNQDCVTARPKDEVTDYILTVYAQNGEPVTTSSVKVQVLPPG